MGESCMCLEAAARWAIRWKRSVIAFWLVLGAAVVPLAMSFTEVLKISLDPSPGTGSEAAQRVFEKYFPANAFTSRFVGYLEATNGSVLDVAGIDEFSRDLRRQLDASWPLTQFMSVPAYQELTAPLGEEAPEMPVPLSSVDKTAMLLTWSIAADPASKEAMAWALTSRNIFMDLASSALGDAISFSGTDSYSQVAGQSIRVAREDLERTDLYCMPFTALVMLLVVGSWRLLIIPGIAMAVVATVSFAATSAIGWVIPVQAVTPSLMMCLIISLSIDYSIFLLSRFREELAHNSQEGDARSRSLSDADRLQGIGVEAAICATMKTSGATILLSGVTILFAFVFLAFFPVNIVASMGIGSCVTMVMLVLVNLTLTPALLALFPDFFSSGIAKQNSGISAKIHGASKAGWKWLAEATTKFPVNLCLLLVVIGVSVALSLPVPNIAVSMDMRQVIASGSHMQETAARIHNKFGGGLAYPFEVLLVPTDKDVPILSNKFFNQSGLFVQAVVNEVESRLPEAKGTAYNFLSYQTGTGRVSFEDMSLLCSIEQTAAATEKSAVSRRLQDDEMPDMGPLCSFYLDSTTNVEDYTKVAPTAAYGVIVASMEPLSKVGHQLLTELRRASEKFGPMYGIEASISGTPTKALDMMSVVYEALPIAAVATLTTAAIFLAVAFQSLVIPVRAILSNLLTLGVTYGCTALVYQDGVFDSLPFGSVDSTYKALPWFAPIVAFFIITGFGLDYDIFLLVRVTELRGKGQDPQSAVREGLVSTGGIITAAGLVMVFAFSGMLFSELVQGSMFGFMMVLAVLFDTFVARSIVNPAGMSLLGHWNWWPSKLSGKGYDCPPECQAELMLVKSSKNYMRIEGAEAA